MNTKSTVCTLALVLALPAAAHACGEGMFNTGRGLPYRAYVAPRPAAVLVYADERSHAAHGRAQDLYAGLQRAGHTVTVVRDASSLEAALRERPYDVVISAFEAVDAVRPAAGMATPKLLPVVSRAARNAPEVKARFDLFLVDGASLGQYLRAIHRLVEPR